MFNSKELDAWLSSTAANGKRPAAGRDLAPETAELSDLWQPDADADAAPDASVEERLFQRGQVTAAQMEEARSIHQKTPRKRIGQILMEMGVVKEAELLACLAEQYELPFIRVERDMVSPAALERLDKAFIEAHKVLPLALENGRLVVATADPTNVFLLDEVQRKTRLPLVMKVCPSEDIKAVLNAFNEGHTTDYQVDDLIKNIQDDDVEIVNTAEEDIADLERVAAESPIIKFVNYIIFNAVKEGASDIHLEPGDRKLKIRYRIDGILFETMNPPHNMHAPVISRIKIMANLDIAQRRLPQDGRIRVAIHGRNVDMRVSTLPTCHGEKIVIRILDTGQTQRSLEELGLEPDTLEIMKHQIARPHGIVLVTGPTGSGKSTTLYACLRTMDVNRLNISTVEDPVEYQLEGTSQVQMHERIGMTFATALRSLLRQDPDVIMVGEIRDEETARIAVQASLTGHLVLSTLHTNDAPSSITRLINIGIEPYLIAASTNAVLAQRLVRRTCRHCPVPYTPPAEEKSFMEMHGFNADNLVRGAGCDRCRHTGFQGRVGLYELLPIDDTYRDIVSRDPGVSELRRVSKERGMVTLREDGFRKVAAGTTTIDEVMRVTECVI
jgi:type IV pilus assembly protein PilB